MIEIDLLKLKNSSMRMIAFNSQTIDLPYVPPEEKLVAEDVFGSALYGNSIGTKEQARRK